MKKVNFIAEADNSGSMRNVSINMSDLLECNTLFVNKKTKILIKNTNLVRKRKKAL